MGFKEVCEQIKNLEIQGAGSIAIAGIKAMRLKGFSEKKILSLRPTEPALRNGIKFAKKHGIKKALKHFERAKNKYVNYGVRKVKKVVFTHCHSSSVISVLKRAKVIGKKFKVYNTETRPKYQGRKTSRELANAGIKVTNIVDSAAMVALKKSDVMIIGADAVLGNGNVINKIGSGMFARIAYDLKVPVYVITDSWKFSSRNVHLEERDFHEVWKKGTKKFKVENPAFGIVEAEYIRAIISELGVFKPDKFVKNIRGKYKWI